LLGADFGTDFHMTILRVQRAAKPIGSGDINVIQAAYALAKAQSDQSAAEVMRGVPTASFPALKEHLKSHPNLFTPEVLAVVARFIAAPKTSAVEALFAR
jgi:hypothetical protein